MREFARFSMFLYSELLKNICGVDVGVEFDIREAQSSRNGLAFALGLENEMLTGKGESLCERDIDVLNEGLRGIVERIEVAPIRERHKTLWSIETTLCAYKKHKLNGKRWVGYYIERMRKEIETMQSRTGKAAGGGVSWQPLWQFRAETYSRQFLMEWQSR